MSIPIFIPAASALPVHAAEDGAVHREEVMGIDGFFFRSADSAALAIWYEEHIGVNPAPTGYDQKVWVQQTRPRVGADDRIMTG
jgi:hypothetical protein